MSLSDKLKDTDEFTEGLKEVEKVKAGMEGSSTWSAFKKVVFVGGSLYTGAALGQAPGFFAVAYLLFGWKMSQQFSQRVKKAAFLVAWLPLVLYGVVRKVVGFVR